MISKQTRGKNAYQTGLSAEKKAVTHYIENGFKIHAERLRTPYGEIDIIAFKKGILVFIEVKARKNTARAAEAISARQWQRLQNAALHFLAKSPSDFHNSDIRFDAALINAIGEITIIENAHSFDEW